MDDQLFDELLESVHEAGRIMRGEQSPSRIFSREEPNVRAIRQQTGLTQARFAALIGVSVRTLQNWEQGHRHPTGPAKVLLTIFQTDAQAVLGMLHGPRVPGLSG